MSVAHRAGGAQPVGDRVVVEESVRLDGIALLGGDDCRCESQGQSDSESDGCVGSVNGAVLLHGSSFDAHYIPTTFVVAQVVRSMAWTKTRPQAALAIGRAMKWAGRWTCATGI